jgi:AcrR family transcriptional regulator
MTASFPSTRREVGRPRVFPDDAIFAAIDLVLRRDGYPELTLEAIANEVGCTRQALVRRFGSKRSLVLRYLEAMEGRVSRQYEAEMEVSDSPIEVLRARLSRPWAQRFLPATDPRSQANLLAFMLTLSLDPDLAVRFATLNDLAIQGIETLLQGAIARGEVRGIDPKKTAHLLYDVWVGETVDWCLAPTIDLPERLSRAFDLIVDPHRGTPA